MERNWKEQTARDIIALGGNIFYSLVVIRALIGPFFPFIYQLLIAALVIFIGFLIFRDKVDNYIARAFALASFTSLLYMDLPFAVFAFIIFLALIYSAFQIGRSKSQVFNGLLAGIVASSLGYFIAPNIPVL